jgi:CubicO group peptidase (beta-lactamase class C family)
MNNDGLHSRNRVDSAGCVRNVTARQCLRRAVVSVLLVGLLVVGGGCTRSSPGPHDPLDTFTAHLDRRVPRLMDRYDVPGASLALVRDGDLVWSGAYGYADLARGRKMTTDAVFRAESISKSVTAWGVMRWVEEGRIDLDDPVQPYLADGALADNVGDAVAVRHLLSQNAGMPLGPIGAGVEYAPQSERTSLRAYLMAEVRPVRDPGTGFLYSNVGFNLLELLVEEVTGRDGAVGRLSLLFRGDLKSPGCARG